MVGLGYTHWSANWRRLARSKDLIPAWSRENDAIFIHVPKNAGLSVRQMFDMGKLSHAPAIAYRETDRAFFSSAFKFAVVRNPWDRMVSAFHFLQSATPFDTDVKWRARHLTPNMTFEDFVLSLQRRGRRMRVLAYPHFAPQWHFVADEKGNLLMDEVFRFERLNEELGRISEKLGRPYEVVHKNSSSHGLYQSYYDDITRRIVGSIYRRDIELFGYSFS